jgi:hypothetical protein
MSADTDSTLLTGRANSLRGWKKLPPDNIWEGKNPVPGTMPREIDGQARAASRESP